METNQAPEAVKPRNRSQNGKRIGPRLLQLLLILLIIGGGIAGANYMKQTAPHSKRQSQPKKATLVEVIEAQPALEQIRVTAMGTVVPAREVELQAQVSGQVVREHEQFAAGSIFAAGEEILLIDPADYQLNMTRKQSALADAIYALKVEEGYQDVARREWELFREEGKKTEEEEELALRKPHLEKARANVAAAEADLLQARLDLERTLIRAPFNGLIKEKQVSVGSQLSTQSVIATLVGTDRYWIQISLPVDQIPWVEIPGMNSEYGSEAVVFTRDGTQKIGKVTKLLGDLEEQGRMARLLIEIEDPLELKKPVGERTPLLLGDYLEVEIGGRLLDDVIPLSRSALRNGSKVWVADSQQQLQIRTVDISWRNADTVFVSSGLQPGERVIVSDLATPVPGLPLRVTNSDTLARSGADLSSGGLL